MRPREKRVQKMLASCAEWGDDSAERSAEECRKECRRVQKMLASHVKWETIAEGVGESRIVEGRKFQVTKEW